MSAQCGHGNVLFHYVLYILLFELPRNHFHLIFSISYTIWKKNFMLRLFLQPMNFICSHCLVAHLVSCSVLNFWYHYTVDKFTVKLQVIPCMSKLHNMSRKEEHHSTYPLPSPIIKKKSGKYQQRWAQKWTGSLSSGKKPSLQTNPHVVDCHAKKP